MRCLLLALFFVVVRGSLSVGVVCCLFFEVCGLSVVLCVVCYVLCVMVVRCCCSLLS